jgi:hypothetical protein
VRSYEHRYIGDAATHAAMVNVGGESVDEAFWLSFGDVVAVSGDFFPQRRTPVTGSDSPESTPSDAPAPETLFDLARVPGQGGTRLDTRDEIVCALKVATVDEAVKDPRFAPGGRFGHFAFSPRADSSDVGERHSRRRGLWAGPAETSRVPWRRRPPPSTTSPMPSPLDTFARRLRPSGGTGSSAIPPFGSSYSAGWRRKPPRPCGR